MTQDEIIKLAMEYGFTGGFDAQGNLTYDAIFVEAVTEAVNREREACAKLCYELPWKDMTQIPSNLAFAAAIRARGEA